MIARGADAGSLTAWFAAGGSGGHLYPALCVADALQQRSPSVACTFLTTGKAIDAQIVGSRWPRRVVDVRPLAVKRPWDWPPGALRLWREDRHIAAAIRQSPPDILYAAGGIHTIPVVSACRRAGVPVVLFNPDVAAGRANRLLSRWVTEVFVQWEASRASFPRSCNIEVTGCPVRSEFGCMDRIEGCRVFDLDPARRTLLVTGASQGASSLNRLMIGLADFLREGCTDWQVLHVAGPGDEAAVRTALARADVPCRVFAYTEKMAAAFAAADLVVTRAGASTLAELAAAGRASILLPYPYGRDRHQYANAEVFAAAQASQVVVDRIDPALTRPALLNALRELTGSEDRRGAMARAAAGMARPDAADAVADLLLRRIRSRDARIASDCMEKSCVAAR